MRWILRAALLPLVPLLASSVVLPTGPFQVTVEVSSVDGTPMSDEVPPLCPVTVTVEGPDGEPLPDARLYVIADSPGWPTSEFRVDANAQGLAAIAHMPCGTARVGVYAGNELAQARIWDIDTTTSPALNVRLVEGVKVSGVVQNVQGEPLHGIGIGEGGIAHARTDRHGHFQFRVDPSEPHTLRASSREFRPTRITVPEGVEGAKWVITQCKHGRDGT